MKKDPEFRKVYDSLEEEFALFDELFKARRRVGLTQAEVAERMETETLAVARLEAGGESKKHSPPSRPSRSMRKLLVAVWKSSLFRWSPPQEKSRALIRGRAEQARWVSVQLEVRLAYQAHLKLHEVQNV